MAYQTVRSKIGILFFLVISLVAMCAAMMIAVDTFCNSYFYKRCIVKADKEFVIPKEYRLMYNPNTSEYMIKKENYPCEWMKCPVIFENDFYWYCEDGGTRFSDSAIAKGALKKYIVQQEVHRKVEHWIPK